MQSCINVSKDNSNWFLRKENGSVVLFWFDNDFEIESKNHRKSCCLVLVHILSSQDVIFRSVFSYILLNCLLVVLNMFSNW